MKKRIKTDLYLNCPCGAKSPVFETNSGWYSHCLGCGRISFWHNPQLTERLKYGGVLCPHDPEPKPNKKGNGYNSWCPICRVRCFIYGEKGR